MSPTILIIHKMFQPIARLSLSASPKRQTNIRPLDVALASSLFITLVK
jgi:hypothetical protein